MHDNSDLPPLWLLSLERIENAEFRAELIRAARRNWSQWLKRAQSRGGETIDAGIVLDEAVSATATARRVAEVRNIDAYLFKVFYRKVRRLVRREQRIEYCDPGELGDLKAAADNKFAQELELGIQVEELVNLMDERMRTIFVMDCQGFSRHETARVLGMTEDAVRKAFARGIEKLRSIVSARTKS
jgi:RNA polymerase sigma factor (sigma-70 family)